MEFGPTEIIPLRDSCRAAPGRAGSKLLWPRCGSAGYEGVTPVSRTSRPGLMGRDGLSGHARNADNVVKGVALERLAARGTDQPRQRGHRHALGRGRAGHVVNLL